MKKRKKSSKAVAVVETEQTAADGKLDTNWFSTLSLEILCRILDYLPFKDVLKLDHKSKLLHEAVSLHLRVKKKIDFTANEIFGWMSDKITDKTLTKLLSRCRDLEYIQGFHVPCLAKRRARGLDSLSVPGITEALDLCKTLKGIEISDIFLLEAILAYLPRVEILGTFKNRIGSFPVDDANTLKLSENPRITSLHLIGVNIPELPPLMYLKHLQLRWVHLSGSHPFVDFAAPQLQTFVMSHCGGTANSNPLKYVRLITTLATASNLQRLELIRVPILGGLLQHVVEDSWRIQGFKKIHHLKFGACKFTLEMDIGYLVITAAPNIEELCLQPSLTKDSLFTALRLADVTFKFLQTLHLGFVDAFPEPGQWTNEDLAAEHLSEVVEYPAMLTDAGMKSVGQCFPELKHVQVYNCPHLHKPTTWLVSGGQTWAKLRELYLRRCHAIRLADFCVFIEQLPNLELLHLEQMFREPPKGCSRVGLSAGTGLGMSSALVGNQQGPNISDVLDVNGGDDSDNDNNNNEMVNEEIGDRLDDVNMLANQEGPNTDRLPDHEESRPSAGEVVGDMLTNQMSDRIETTPKKCSDMVTSSKELASHENCMKEYQRINSNPDVDGRGTDQRGSLDRHGQDVSRQAASSGAIIVNVSPFKKKTANDAKTDTVRDEPSSSTKKLFNNSNNEISDNVMSFTVSTNLLSHGVATTNQKAHTTVLPHGQRMDSNAEGVEENPTLYGSCSFSESTMAVAVSERKAKHAKERTEEDERMEIDSVDDDAFLLHAEELADEDTDLDDDDQSLQSTDSSGEKLIVDTIERKERKEEQNGSGDTMDVNQCNVVQDKILDSTDNYVNVGYGKSSDSQVAKCESNRDELSVSQKCLSTPENLNVPEQESTSSIVSDRDGHESLDTTQICTGGTDINICRNQTEKVDRLLSGIKTLTNTELSDKNATTPKEMVCDSNAMGISQTESNCKDQGQCQTDSKGQGQCPTDSKGQGQCQTDSKGQGQCQTDSKGQGQCQTDSKGQGQCHTDSEGQGQCQTDSKGQGQCHTDSKGQGQYQTDSKGQGQYQTDRKGQGQCQTDSKGQGQCHTVSKGQGQCQTDSKGQGQCQTDGKGQGQCQNDSKGQGQCQSDNKGQGQCQTDSKGQGQCQANSKGQGQCHTDSKGPGQGQTDSKGQGQCQTDNKGQVQCQTDSKGKGQWHTDNKDQGQCQTDSKGKGQGQCQTDSKGQGQCQTDNKGQGQCQTDSKGQGQCQTNSKGQGQCQTDSKGQGHCQPDNKGQGQCQTDSKGQGQCQTDRAGGIVTISFKLTTDDRYLPVIDEWKTTKKHTTDLECNESNKTCDNCLGNITSKRSESDFGIKNETFDTLDDDISEIYEEEDKLDENEEENILIVRREKARGYKVTNERVSRTEKIIHENKITLTGEVTVRSQSGEITIGQGHMTGIVPNVVVMLGMTINMPKATGTRQLGRDIVVTIAGQSTYVGSGEIDVSVANGKKIIAILQTDTPIGPCETLTDVLRNCGMPSILDAITDTGNFQNTNVDKNLDHQNRVDSDREKQGQQLLQSPADYCQSGQLCEGFMSSDTQCNVKFEVEILALQNTGLRDDVSAENIIQCSPWSRDEASDRDIIQCSPVSRDEPSDRDIIRCSPGSRDEASDRDMIRCGYPVRGILHTCSGLVVLLSPCCQTYDDKHDTPINIAPSALGAFWSYTVHDPVDVPVVGPCIAMSMVDNSAQPGQVNNKACQTQTTSAQGDPSNLVVSCISMGGPTTKRDVGVSSVVQPVTRVDGRRMIDQATSTSDPVVEEDHIQVLDIKSKSLNCVTLHMVGITDLVLDCPNLTRVTGSACRVLKTVTIESATKVQKISFAQCKKINEEYLLEQITSQSAIKNRIVHLRPLHKFDCHGLEERLFGRSDVDYGLCVVYDYSPSPQDTLYNKARVDSWLNLFSGITLELLESYNFQHWDGVTTSKYPWNRTIYTLAGKNENGSRWELITDIPWLRPLAECVQLSDTHLSKQDQKVGVYCPRAKGHFGVTECLADLQTDIAEKQVEGIGLAGFFVVVYINMCDVSGVPQPDPYV